MTDRENFLERWSRKKAQAAHEPLAPATPPAQADAAPGEVGGERPDERDGPLGAAQGCVREEREPLAADERDGRRGRDSRLLGGEDGPGQLLRLLDVRLVERVDPEHGSGDRGRHFPADELAAEVHRIGEGDPDHGVAEGRQLGEELVGIADLVGRGGPARAAQREADEDAVVAVPVGRAERLEVDRHDPDAVLAGTLGDQLLEPGTERRDLRVGDEGELVAPALRKGPDRQAECEGAVDGRVLARRRGREHHLRRHLALRA